MYSHTFMLDYARCCVHTLNFGRTSRIEPFHEHVHEPFSWANGSIAIKKVSSETVYTLRHVHEREWAQNISLGLIYMGKRDLSNMNNLLIQFKNLLLQCISKSETRFGNKLYLTSLSFHRWGRQREWIRDIKIILIKMFHAKRKKKVHFLVFFR